MPYLKYNGQYIASGGKYTVGIAPIIPLLSFTTESFGDPFDPEFTLSSGVLEWDLGDASTSVNSNDFSHTYGSAGNKTVKVYDGTSSGAASITEINMGSDNLVGSLDISNLTNLTDLYIGFNSNLTSITNPVSSAIWTRYAVLSTGLTSLDLSGLSGLGGTISFRNSSNLTEVLLPNSSEEITLIQGWSCNLTGTLDASGLTGIGTYLYIQTNPNLAEFILPDTLTQPFLVIDVNSCSLSQNSVDDIFLKLDTYFDSNAPTSSLSVSLQGGTNSAPTDGSSNINIQNLETTFSNAGQSFTYNIN